ncbi:Uncharacterised protein [uncultured archaeon]|nr:Uncharacterised protein [uncultured archaeon]
MTSIKTHNRMLFIMAIALGVILFAGCAGQSTNQAANQTTATTAAATTCSSKDCFAPAANNCSDISIQVTEVFGTMKYSSSGCVFTKTMISLNQNESADMKKALEGKSLSCVYEKGKFDSGWLSSLVAGIENCSGNLKDAIGQLVLFS